MNPHIYASQAASGKYISLAWKSYTDNFGNYRRGLEDELFDLGIKKQKIARWVAWGLLPIRRIQDIAQMKATCWMRLQAIIGNRDRLSLAEQKKILAGLKKEIVENKEWDFF